MNNKLCLDNYINYKSSEELWVITVYYNPCSFESRKSTYDSFMYTMQKSGVNVLTIECAFGNDKFDLPDSLNVIKIRSNSLLWQKERLINLGASYLPSTCKYVAWIDCDVVFDNSNWVVETCEKLSSKYTILQLWETASRLSKGNIFPEFKEDIYSFAYITSKDKSTIDAGRYDLHGHTGYAWAMRREIFDKLGLYEFAISGSSDHFMAHAVYNTYGFCIENAMKHDKNQINHFKKWGNDFYSLLEGKLGVVSGNIYHLWHGSQDKRNYFSRMWKVVEFGYNPYIDILSLPGKTLEWKKSVIEEKPKLVSFFAEYFESRQEDTE